MEEYPKPMNKICIQKIFNQMNTTFYEINQNIIFFCNIKYQNKKIPVLIINKCIYNEDMHLYDNITINKEKIELDHFIYKNKDDNISIINIKNNNNNKNINYIEIDDKLYEKDSEMYYNKESIYTMQYNSTKDILVSYGIIKGLNKDKLKYTGNINSKYALIFNLSNNKLIGIHKNSSKYYNNGIFLKYIIKEYENKYNYWKNKDNEITMKLKIDKDDINKDIYFLDNYNTHNNLKELNNMNTEIYIDDIKQKEFRKYFIPIKEGECEIKLKFKINIEDCSYMFAGCNNIITINFNSFKSKYIINTKNMFYNCENLRIIDLYSFDTKNIINMEYMFYNCKSLNNLDLSFLNIKKATKMKYMLYNFINYKNLDLSWYDLNNIEINNIFGYSFNIIYKINQNEHEIKLFGSNFVKNNKDNCYLSIQGKKIDICSWWKLDQNQDEKNIFKIILIIIKPITNMSHMFSGCHSLINLPDISKLDTKNVTNMSGVFNYCNSLINLADISKWDTQNVTNMSSMFLSCSSLNKLPDISKWNTKNVTDMSYMFSDCSSLINFPDISKWNTKNVKDMSWMFYNCKSLLSLPDISKWNTNNVNDMSDMFSDC